MAKRSQQDSGEERVTAKSRPMMNLIARTPSFVSSSTSVSLGKKHYGSQDPWKSVAGEVDQGDLIKAQICLKPPINTTMSNSWKASLQQVIKNWMTTVFWSSQEWTTETTTYDRSLRPDKISWRMVRKVRPGHEEILLDGTAQSERNGETLRGRSGRPDNINSQEVARPQNSVMGNDETELELSVESRSFVNRVNEQVRKRQKIISNVTEGGEEHSMI